MFALTHSGMLEQAQIDNGDLRVAAMSFSTEISVHFYLNQYSSKQHVMEAIRMIPYIPGSTNTADGLMTLTNEMFSQVNGDRKHVPNLAIVITDGISNLNSDRTIPEAMRAKSRGIHVFTVGIGLTGATKEIDAISTYPPEQNRFLVRTFDELRYIRTQVYTRLCESK